MERFRALFTTFLSKFQWLFGVGLSLAYVMTAIFGWVTDWIGAAIFVRVLAGVGQGVIFSSAYQLTNDWAPPEERTTLYGIFLRFF